MSMHRRHFLAGSGALALLPALPARGQAPLLTVSSRVLEVNGKAAKVFAVTGANGRPGLFAQEGERFTGTVRNETGAPLVMHWHGQVHAPFDQDRARPDGGALPDGASDTHDFLLTPGTHWTHSHQLSEQRLLAAPMITREKDAGDVQDVVVMLHDFAFRSPEETLHALGGTDAHAGHGGSAPQPGSAPQGMNHSGMNHGTMNHGSMNHGSMNHGRMPGMGSMPGMNHGRMAVHANDIAYDAFLANDRTLADPEVVRVSPGQRVRLRIINGATATAFILDTQALEAECVAVDGSPCLPLKVRNPPLAQGQRIDLLVTIPREGGVFPILAQVEAGTRRTGIVLASGAAQVAKIVETAARTAPHADLTLDENLRAARPLPPRPIDRGYMLMLGEEPGYRWTINGRIHGAHQPLEAKVGERISLTFMNPTMMMHPMHIHGHHFQVVGSRRGNFAGPLRDTVIVPPHSPISVILDVDKPGSWFLHCHHLYHMATGMMTEVKVS